MKVYRMTVMFIDFDGIGPDSACSTIEDVRLPNHTINGVVMDIDEREVEWTDNHPLNNRGTRSDAFDKLFEVD